MQLRWLPEVFSGAVQLGVRDVMLPKAPLDGSGDGHDADQPYVSACPSESVAVTVRLTTPPDPTGFGVPVGPAMIVNVCDGGGEVQVHVGLSVPSQHKVRPLEQPQTPLCEEQQPDCAKSKKRESATGSQAKADDWVGVVGQSNGGGGAASASRTLAALAGRMWLPATTIVSSNAAVSITANRFIVQFPPCPENTAAKMNRAAQRGPSRRHNGRRVLSASGTCSATAFVPTKTASAAGLSAHGIANAHKPVVPKT
jgi:hypothetical protein